MTRRYRTGRVQIDFAVIERFAAEHATGLAILAADDRSWTLSSKSAIHRCKNGTYTVVLIWTNGTLTMSSRTRGVRLERA